MQFLAILERSRLVSIIPGCVKQINLYFRDEGVIINVKVMNLPHVGCGTGEGGEVEVVVIIVLYDVY